jgi:hypothetical protein
MKPLFRLASFVALALTVAPPVLFALGAMGEPAMKLTLLGAAILWFATAPRWMHGGGD